MRAGKTGSDTRPAFLIRLSDALRAEPDEEAVACRALGMLADELRLDRCCIGVYRIEDDWADFTHQVGNDRTPPVPDGVRLSDFPEALRIALDRTLVIDDVASAEGLSEADKQNLRGLGMRALVAATLRKGDDQPVWAIVAISASARSWTPGDVALIEEFAERTWALIERKRAETAQRKSERRLDSALAVARLGAFEWNIRTNAVELDDRARQIFGFAGEEGANADEVFGRINPDDLPRVRAEVGASQRTLSRLETEYRISLPGGATRIIRSINDAVAGADGKAERMIGVFDDVTGRYATEAALRASEARYRVLFDSIQAGFCTVEVKLDAPGGRTDYRVVEANPAFYQQTGFPQAILGEWLREAAPDLEEHWYEVYGRVARTGQPERLEQGSDHLGRWFDVYAFRVGEPEAGRVAILFNDISARRNAEERLRELNETLEQKVAERTAERDRTWNNARDLLLVVDTGGVFRAVNPAWTDILGWNADELVGRSYLDFIHPDDHPSSRGALATASHEPLPSYENRYRQKDGGYRWISWVAASEGDLIYATGRDVTAEKERQAKLAAAEDARRQADALYRAYFENTAEALFVVGVLDDGGFTVEDLNPAHQSSIGLPLSEVRGKRIDEVLPPDLSAQVADHYRRVTATGEVYQYRETFHLNGSPTYWDTVLVPVLDAGRIVRIIGASRDLTAQLAAEEQLRQSQKLDAMGQLTGGVAHDFNNLLTPIIGSLDMLVRKGVGSERERRLIDGALQSAERAKTLVQRLLAFARRQPLQPTAVDLQAVVLAMSDLISSTLGPQIDVQVDLEPGIPPVTADPNQLEMALLNLAVNARDAMPEGGTLTIAAQGRSVRQQSRSGLGRGHYVVLRVTDTGVGMDEATLARAVEPFFSTKGVGRGTGLGLSMVHGLAAQLGGELKIDSSPGRGATIELWLPISPVAVEADDASPEPPAVRRRRGAALLVDDEDLVRMSTADMLTDLGFEVIEAVSAEAALRLVEEGVRPDLLITDHLMPGMNGAELANRLRKSRADLPVLIVSGYAEAEGVALDLPRLTKPFRQADLAAKLAEVEGAT